jgi:hypothetical protein
MLEQVLDREFVLTVLRAAKDDVERSAPEARRSGPSQLQSLSIADRKSLAKQLRNAEASERIKSSGQEGFDSLAVRRSGARARPIDRTSFFSRSAVVSNFQSAIEQYYEEHKPRSIELTTTGKAGRRGSKTLVPAADRRISDLPSKGKSGRRLAGAFEVTDIRWISALAAMGLRMFRGKHEFQSAPASVAPFEIKENARLTLVGDWGTGLPRAQAIATQMSKYIKDGRQKRIQQHVIHLGDVYYSGWEREYKTRFLDYWPVDAKDAPDIGSWTLNGNHDMYSGGFGYYDVALKDERFGKWHNGSSFFSLSNRNWLIVGLDSAYDDFDLRDPQAEWLYDLIMKPAHSKKKILLLSHHQLFSAYEHGGPKLSAKLEKILATKRVVSWFWGHEHRCVLYRSFDGVPFGRCIGHGGVPVYMTHGETDAYPDPAVYEYRKYIDAGLERWALFGFGVLDFKDDVVNVRYVDEFGVEYKKETIA